MRLVNIGLYSILEEDNVMSSLNYVLIMIVSSVRYITAS